MSSVTTLADGEGHLLSGRLSLRAHAWVADHEVFGSLLVPGTGVLDLALAAGRAVGAARVAELTLAAPLMVDPERPVRLQVRVGAATGEGRRTLTVHSRPEAATEPGVWTLHATGELSDAADGPDPDATDLRDWPARGTEAVDLDGFYEGLASEGLAYGPAFRGLVELRRGDRVVYGRVVLPQQLRADAGSYGVHPALFDAALHVMAGFAPTDSDENADTAFLPFLWSDVQLYATGSTELRVRIELEADSDGSTGSTAASVLISDPSGEVVLRAGSLRLQRVSAEQLRSARDTHIEHLYRVDFQAVSLPDRTLDTEGTVVLGEGGLAAALGLEAQTVAEAALAAAPRRLLVDLTDGTVPGDDVVTAAHRRTAQALELVQRLLTDPALAATEVTWVTRAAVGTDRVGPVDALADSPLWGLLRTVRAEHPERVLRVLGLDEELPGTALLESALAAGEEPELVLRGARALAPRLVRAGSSDALVPPRTEGAWQLAIGEKGRIDTLELVSADRTEPLGAGEVRVRVRAAGVSPRAVLDALDTAHAPVLGRECAGVVLETGAEVTHLQVGDRVMGLAPGTFGTEARADARAMSRIPDGLGFEEAATIPLAFLTAYYALADLGGLRPDEKVLVHTADGDVGLAAAQLAHHLGARVYATAGPAQWPVLRRMGIPDERIAGPQDAAFDEKWLAATGGTGVDLVLDAMAGESAEASLRLLPRGGRFLETGTTGVLDPAEVAAARPGVVYQACEPTRCDPRRLMELLAELVRLFEQGVLTPLPFTAYDVRDAAEAFRLVAQGRHVGKVVLTPPRALDPQGTVLITGGTGELGRAVAGHLVRAYGVRHLVLTSRRGPDGPDAARAVADLEAVGAAEVRVLACDASRHSEVAAVLAEARPGHPWTAVVHLAGVIDDGLVAGQDARRLAAVLAPKVDGAFHLHELTRHLDLAAFVLFSSAAGVLGSPGQSTYGAANAFLDALAAHRSRRGLPALSLAWGLWAPGGSGMTAGLSAADLARMDRQGAGALSVSEGLDLLDKALDRPGHQVVPVKLSTGAARPDAAEVPALLRALVRPQRLLRQAAGAAAEGSASLRARLLATGPAERSAALTEVVRLEVALVMGFADEAQVTGEQPLKDLGVDSLTSMELRKRLADLTQCVLPTDLAFSFPTPRAIAEHLLDLLFTEAVAEGSGMPAVRRSAERSVHPATEGQKRLWFMERIRPGSIQYNAVLKLRVAKALDRDALERALEWVAARHEVLRTTLVLRGDELVQEVRARADVPVSFTDVSGRPSEVFEREVRRIEHTPFEVDGGPLVRLHVVQGDREQMLLLVMHHSVTDGWSGGVMLPELYGAYRAFADGEEPEGPEIGHQLGDYARWERECLAEGHFDEGLRFFASELAGVQRLDLPSASAEGRPAGGDAVYFSLPAALRDELEAVAAASSVTPYTVYVSAFAVLLARYSGQDDFALGTIWSNRQMSETERMVGFLANTLPMRCDLTGAPSFRTVLERTRPRVLGLLEHQSVPLTEIVRVAGAERTGDENPLFRAAFNYMSVPAVTLGEGEDAWVRPESGSALGNVRGGAKFELALTLASDGEGLLGEFEFLPAVLDREAAQRMADNLSVLLAAIVRDPDLPIGELELLGGAEQDWLRENGTYVESEVPAVRTALDLFLERSRATPDAVALVAGSRELTYGELALDAARLAVRLREQGVAPRSLVGIRLPRSADLVVAMLATWLAGGAYVPLDPEYPPARLDHVIGDSALGVIVSTGELEPLAVDAGVLVVDVRDAGTEPEPTARAQALLDGGPSAPATDPAYVIYTSGSTGKPKGVVLEHAQFANFCRAMDERVGGGPGDTWLAVTSSSFDISTLELLWTLTRGYRVVVAQGGVETWPSYRAHRPTHLQCTPSLARMLVADAEGRALLAGLDRLLVGGEALDRPLAERLLRSCGGSVTNMYGPTETTVWSATWEVTGGEVSLGRPVLNTRLYVLDERRRPVPLGSRGELWIGGLGVARGYLHRPELTAERFVTDPFAGEAQARMYRTGDVVRYRADGSLEFCGRVDAQIKLRGHRIELGEIEAVAAGHPGVAQCAAVVREDVAGDPRLYLYWVPAGERRADVEELREFIAGRLPSYMVPARLVTMSGLPHTPNQKIDRNALLALEPVDTARDGEGGADGGDAGGSSAPEDLIAEVWASVLGLAVVDRDRGFFDLGGSSMSALRAHERICGLLGREFPLSAVFRYPTVRRLAAFLGGGARPAAVATRAVRPSDDGDAVAVVGMACRLPGAPDVAAYWDNLRNGVESIRRFTAEELRAGGVPEALLGHPSYIPAKGWVEDADLFDAGFFGFSPAEAESMDPQHRLFLECAWQGLETAGIVPKAFDGRIAVFGGTGQGRYQQDDPTDLASFYQSMVGTKNDFLATRVAHRLDLRGPAMTLQTACSTGLVATHLARESLLRGESDVALVGASSISFPLVQGYPYQEGMVSSPDGVCRAFDAQGGGTVFGDGVGVVVLRRLSDALEAGDTVYAVLRGSAVNNDGSDKVGFTAPSVDGQADVIAAAQGAAGVLPDTIGFVEAHGTATALGDPIEVQALQQVFGATRREEPCAIGSVKTNIGHTDATAGIAGLIKAALCVYHGELVPSLHYERPNPEMGLDPELFYVNTELKEWRSTQGPRRAGVSSFGIGGTNAHVVLEEPPVRKPTEGTTASAYPVVLSARSEGALREQAGRWASWLAQRPGTSPADMAVTAALHRSHFAVRAGVVAADGPGLVEALEALAADRPHEAVVTGSAEPRGKVVFVYPGQGSQWAGMGRELLLQNPVFAQVVDECDAALRPWTGWSVRAVLAGEDDGHPPVDRVDVIQPALFAMGVALSAVWRSLGVEPAAVVGHSQGELVAAVVSGALTLEQGARIIAVRSRAILPIVGQGGMALVTRPLAEVEEFIAPYGEALSVAAINTAGSTVVSGRADSVAELVAELSARDVYARTVKVDYASHSAQMDQLLPALSEEFTSVVPRRGDIAFYSTVTGGPADGTELDGGYWCRNLREPVRFDRALEQLVEDGHTVFVEISAHPVLSMPLVESSGTRGGVVVGSLAREHGGTDQMLRNLALLHVGGHEIDWNRVLGTGSVLDLPTYAFQRRRYWKEPARKEPARSRTEQVLWDALGTSDPDTFAGLLEVPEHLRAGIAELVPHLQAWRRRHEADASVADWLYEDTWQLVDTRPKALRPGEAWAVVTPDGAGAHEALADAAGSALGAAGAQVHRLAVRGSGEEIAHTLLTLPGELAGVLTLTSLDEEARAAGGGAPERFFLTADLLRELGTTHPRTPLWALTSGAVRAEATDPLSHPLQSMVAGLGRDLAPHEPQRWGGVIDVPRDTHDGWAEQLVAAMTAGDHEDHAALRPGGRYVRRLRRVTPGAGSGAWSTDGTALITGGTDALGLPLARWLAAQGARHIVLAARRAQETPEVARTRAGLAADGVELTLVACDLADRGQVEELVRSCDRADAPLRTVAHLAGPVEGAPAPRSREDLVREDIDREVSARTAGAWHLHEVLGARELDAFVLHGSGSALWGGAGQAANGAADTALDALAVHRRARGLAATVVHWGDRSGGGTTSSHDTDSALRARGLRAMEPDKALQALGIALRTGRTALGVADVDWAVFTPSFCAARPRPLLREIDEARAAMDAADQAADRSAGEALRSSLAELAAPGRIRKLLELVTAEAAAVLGLAPTTVGPDTPLQQLGMDSLMAITLRGGIARRTGVSVSTETVHRLAHCSGLARHLLEELRLDTSAGIGGSARVPERQGPAAGSGRWIQVLKPSAAPRARILAFSGMGGSTTGHVPLIRHVPDDVELLAVALPGRESRIDEEPVTDMDVLVDAVSEAVSGLLDLPTVLYGHSQGAWVAWELAHRLAGRAGVPPLALVAACAVPPTEMAPLTDRLRDLSTLWESAAPAELAESFRGVLPDQVLDSEELFTGYIGALRSDVTLAGTYREALAHVDRAALDIPIVAVAATEDLLMPERSLMAWAGQTRAGFTARSVAGGHAAPMENPEAVAAALLAAVPQHSPAAV
ncbi:amino acid adenylation domain-containing protein [Streptomyces sp. NPDC089795]|uniref:non-ribosomal peptide synthetase/type I polyketide synthase n=1 Tax=Streptomyces sp. NPDC089795 TaxID=3155297 RepID=UPI00343BFBBA